MVPTDPPPTRLELNIAHEPRGKVYARLLGALWDECPIFSLVYQRWANGSEIAGFRLRLELFLVSEGPVSYWPGTAVIGSFRELPLLAKYRLTEETRGILLEPKGLYQWKAPKRPEDLALYDASGQFWLGSVTHERMARLSVPQDFLPRLKAIPNLRVAGATRDPRPAGWERELLAKRGLTTRPTKSD
jgi:hypothetical protein